MTMPLYRKILDEASTVPLITEVCITGLGEPTLDPHLVARVKYARDRKPKAAITMFTNGVYMTPARFNDLRDSGLNFLAFSLNALDADQHKAQMGLDSFDTVCANADYAIKNRRNMRVEIRAVVTGWSREDLFRFSNRWGVARQGGHGQMIFEGNWAGDNRTTHQSFKPNEACSRALSQIYVTWDGKVTTCCFDPAGTQVWGNLNTETLRNVYSSPEYLKFREAHFENRADEYAICKGCTRI